MYAHAASVSRERERERERWPLAIGGGGVKFCTDYSNTCTYLVIFRFVKYSRANTTERAYPMHSQTRPRLRYTSSLPTRAGSLTSASFCVTVHRPGRLPIMSLYSPKDAVHRNYTAWMEEVSGILRIRSCLLSRLMTKLRERGGWERGRKDRMVFWIIVQNARICSIGRIGGNFYANSWRLYRYFIRRRLIDNDELIDTSVIYVLPAWYGSLVFIKYHAAIIFITIANNYVIYIII